jgi:hypothetical protein
MNVLALPRVRRIATVRGAPDPYSIHQKGMPPLLQDKAGIHMLPAKTKVWCLQCGWATVYGDPAAGRREFGPSWPFDAGAGDAPGLLSQPLAPPVACSCHLGRSTGPRSAPCPDFTPTG